VDPLLTREEVAAVVAETTGIAREPIAERVDLAGGDRLLRTLLPALDPFVRRVGERLRALLTPLVKADVRVQAAPAQIVAPSSWPCQGGYVALASLRVADMPFGGLLMIDPAITSLLVSRAFGSRRTVEDPPQRSLSAVERRVVSTTVESIVHEIGAAFREVAPLAFSLGRIEADERALHLERWGGAGLLVTASVQTADLSGSLSLGLATAALEPLRVHLLRRSSDEGAASAARETAVRIGRLVRDATLEMTVVIGQARLTLAQLVALRAGDVVHLDRAVGDPIPVRLEGVTKFSGRPVLSRGSLSVELAGRVEETR
jgi:flagellar motor switch protein FliM